MWLSVGSRQAIATGDIGQHGISLVGGREGTDFGPAVPGVASGTAAPEARNGAGYTQLPTRWAESSGSDAPPFHRRSTHG